MQWIGPRSCFVAYDLGMNTSHHFMFLVLFVIVSVGMFSGCASMNKDSADAAPVPMIEGRWKGTWLSSTNGHTGDLWCIVTREADGSLLARYRATYGAGINFTYEMPMTVKREGDVLRFSAETDLGDPWGNYSSEGTVKGDQFTATYTSEFDSGTFDMTRLTGPVEQDEAVAGQ